MGSIAAAVDAYVEQLKAAGLRAWLKRADVQPPGFYVALEEISYVLSGVDMAVCRTYAVTSITDEARAMRELEDLHQKYLDAGFTPEGTTTVVGLNLPGQAGPLPALRITSSLVT